jgi:hypothetical protein
MWQVLSQSVTTLLQKGHVVDTLYFGTFAKLQQGLVYCPGPKSLLKLVENNENVIEIP